jgi:hypothetical protein
MRMGDLSVVMQKVDAKVGFIHCFETMFIFDEQKHRIATFKT